MHSSLLLSTLHVVPLAIALITGGLAGWLFCANLRWAVASALSSDTPTRILALSASLRIAFTVAASMAIANTLGGLYVIPMILTFVISRRIFTSIYANQNLAHDHQP